jgi:hypothetical protein
LLLRVGAEVLDDLGRAEREARVHGERRVGAADQLFDERLTA